MSVSQCGGDSREVALSEPRSKWSVHSFILQFKLTESGELSIQFGKQSSNGHDILARTSWRGFSTNTRAELQGDLRNEDWHVAPLFVQIDHSLPLFFFIDSRH